MRIAPHDLFFWGASSFLIGDAIASATVGFADAASRISFLLAAYLLMATLMRLAGKKELTTLCLACAAFGSAYLFAYAGFRNGEPVRFGTKTELRGVVTRAEHRLDSQALSLDNGLEIFADRYPEFAYGDELRLEGVVEKSKSPFFSGTVNARHARISLVGRHRGNPLKENLIRAKEAFEGSLKRNLPHEQAAFLAGLTFGTTEEFSKKLSAELKASGTTHLVALSGANITGIMDGVAVFLLLFLPPRKLFWPLLAAMTLFVVMTGAESSLVRAATMTAIFMVGRKIERARSFRNALAGAALGMTLWDPRLLVFDLGFQLSFVAIMGLAYLKPVLEKISPWKNRHFLEAVAAQLAVMPVLYLAVGRATPWAIVPNLLLVPVIAPSVGLGFLTGALGLIHPALAFAPAWFAGILLAYAMAVIRFFAFGM